MEKFIVSARKYRPNNFSSLVGQDSIAVTLKNAILKDQLAHAYLFCGPRGVGKTSTARIFAKTINCLNPGPNMEPCGECESCLSFVQGRSYCIHELDAASNNSVDDIRLLTEKVRIPPQVGKYSVYIIDEVHMLSAAAFNAFLKTLEEPPAHAIFILATTEKHKILPTILSRCQTYDFNRISIEEIVRNLSAIAQKEGIDIDNSSLHVIATKADGAMRDALTLFDQAVAFCGAKITYDAVIKNLNVLDYEYLFNIIESSLAGQYNKSLLLFDEILQKGFNAFYFISGLGSHIRNLLVCKDAPAIKMVEAAPDIIERYKLQSSKCSIMFLYEALSATTKCEADYRFSNNQRLLVEFLLIKLSMFNAKQDIVVHKSLPKPVQEPIQEPIQESVQEPAQEPVQESTSVIESVPEPIVDPVKKVKKEDKPKGGLSIKNIIKKSQALASSPSNDDKAIVTDNDPVTIEKLINAWSLMAEGETTYPRLKNAILNTPPVLEDDNLTVVFNVGNSSQQVWIEKNSLPKLNLFLQKTLKNGNVKLVIRVQEVDEQDKKLYMPQEKAEFLLSNNPELKELKKDLDLDIK